VVHHEPTLGSAKRIKRFFEKIQKNSVSLHIGHVQYIKTH